MGKNLVEASRLGWHSHGDNPSAQELTLGCLQRIAAATERSCLDREKLERDYLYMRGDRDNYRRLYDTEKRSNAALRGHITRLRRAASIAKGEK